MALLLAGCASVSRFEKPPVVAFGEKPQGASEYRNYLIRADLEKAGLSAPPPFVLQLAPKQPPVRADMLPPDLISGFLPAFSPPPQWPQKWVERLKGYQVFEARGYYISFKEGHLNYIGLCSHCGDKQATPTIGRADGGVLYAMPLTLAQLVEIFGKPERLYNVQEVRY